MRIPAFILSLCVAGSLAESAAAQSLAEVAKKEEDRRKAANSAPKVYTNGDLREVPAAAAPVTDGGGAASAPGAPSSAPGGAGTATTPAADTKADAAQPDKNAAADAKGETKDREYWSKRISAAREALERNRVLAEAVQSRINALTADFVNRDDPSQRATIANDRDRAVVELERLKKAIAADEKAVPSIEEEARRAGVPPGWLR